MRLSPAIVRGACVLACIAGLASTAQASTFVRASLEDLSASNEIIVLGEVLETVSYWNADGSFILTDVTFATDETIKGRSAPRHTLTLMGGTVGDRTALLVGTAQLVPGRSYLLFLDRTDLPGAPRALTVRDHGQGAFEITSGQGGLRAVSQAQRAHLMPDREGHIDVPGGLEGLPLEGLIDDLRNLVRRQQEVSR